MTPSTILVVDDIPAIHKIIYALLRDDALRLEHAYSGHEAIAKALAIKPDLVLLDVMMPDIDGFEVCRRLRSEPTVADVPIIMVTALTDRSARLRGFAVGADDFVSKPFDQAELRVRVRTITRLDRYRRLLAARARFDRLVELAPDGVLIVSADGVVQLVNPALLHMLDRPHVAVMGQPMADFVDAAERGAWLNFVATAMQEAGGSHVIELILRRADGSPTPVEITAGAIEWDGAAVVQMLVRDNTRRKADQEMLQHRNLELRRLAGRLAEVQEQERQRMARELHDSVGQSLTAINLNLSVIGQLLDKAAPAAVNDRLQDSLHLLEDATKQVRLVMAELRPPLLDEYGLVSALRWYGDQFSARTGVSCLVLGADLTPRPARAVEMALFRICQEALTNVAKHSGASEVVIHLLADDDWLRLSIGDNGQGFAREVHGQAAALAHWGLATMRERAVAVNGDLEIASVPGKGAQILVTVKREVEP